MHYSLLKVHFRWLSSEFSGLKVTLSICSHIDDSALKVTLSIWLATHFPFVTTKNNVWLTLLYFSVHFLFYIKRKGDTHCYSYIAYLIPLIVWLPKILIPMITRCPKYWFPDHAPSRHHTDSLENIYTFLICCIHIYINCPIELHSISHPCLHSSVLAAVRQFKFSEVRRYSELRWRFYYPYIYVFHSAYNVVELECKSLTAATFSRDVLTNTSHPIWREVKRRGYCHRRRPR
jgi:hypothetical protein